VSTARDLDALLADRAEAVEAAAELVAYGPARWAAERPLRLAGEAVVGRIGDIASKLPAALVAGTPALPWAEIKGMRIVVDHAYHRIDYARVWRTLQDDVPHLDQVVRQWVAQVAASGPGPEPTREATPGGARNE